MEQQQSGSDRDENQEQEIDLDEFLYTTIDLLASAYGWSIDTILTQVYPEDVDFYQKKIFLRQVRENKLRLAIQYTDNPKRLWEIFDQENKNVEGVEQTKLDKEGLKRFKKMMQSKNIFK